MKKGTFGKRLTIKEKRRKIMRKNGKRFWAATMSVMMAAALTACSGGNTAGGNTQAAAPSSAAPAADKASEAGETAGEAAAEGGEYIIGCPQPLTGTNAQPGECALNAVKLAEKQFNEQGGINGKKVVVLSYDDQGLPEEAVYATVAWAV